MSRRNLETVDRSGSSQITSGGPDYTAIEALAYEHWLKRGCPIGSDQDDWFRACVLGF
jgi:hypothetical protein